MFRNTEQEQFAFLRWYMEASNTQSTVESGNFSETKLE